MSTVRILTGKCVELMRTLTENSVDAVVTDPPYGIGFMGKAWDHKAIVERAAQRAGYAQPPAKGGGKRAAPRLALAEEAGAYDFSPRGMTAFQEFSREWAAEALRVLKPGGHLLSFASPRTYHRMAAGVEDAGFEIRDQIMWLFGSGFPKSRNLDGAWEGWGTALKPAHEPIVFARKPLIGSVKANVERFGCGALNIDGCRVETATARSSQFVYGAMKRGNGRSSEASANSENKGPVGFKMRQGSRRDDAGSAARFFYCAKASKADREAGCEGLPTKRGGMVSNTSGQHITRRDGGEPGARANHHPTVKPTELMRWLVRLVTPPGGTVLDPFGGSGTTGRAASLEGFNAILIDEDPEYVTIARARAIAEMPLLVEVTE